MRMFRSAQGFLAIASASLALLILVYGDFAPGGAALPGWIPFRELWTHVAALLVLAASLGLCFSRTAMPGALIIGGYEAVWAVISLPQLFSAPLSFGAWYPVCEALTSLAGPCILYALLHGQAESSGMPASANRAVYITQAVFGLTCIFYGASHFAYAAYTAAMVPAWLPGSLAFACFTGLCHIAAGLGIVIGILPRLAAVLETVLMSLFGLLVWAPTFFVQSPPRWATPPHNQWSEVVVNLVLVASAWMVAVSLKGRPWGFARPA